MVDVYTYLIDMPKSINELVTPCDNDAYTIYINSRLCDQRRREAYKHAIKHIINDDFTRSDVQEIETDAHG